MKSSFTFDTKDVSFDFRKGTSGISIIKQINYQGIAIKLK